MKYKQENRFIISERLQKIKVRNAIRKSPSKSKLKFNLKTESFAEESFFEFYSIIEMNDEKDVNVDLIL